ncbi:hypothetical protein LEP1GSC150_3066 [Leptospira interrogans serovar Copenhageni str. LT2050]|uniref:Uncharacterized protein n=1 Tax=Leptospira interrogans serovar Copenhageni str. LT2050 TaxID=1001598 RepID=M3GBW0_LEPIT|nr:hypothetical protein LEP1GSC150_3066 [Leptospira interrogans serovar Copenhageni str. LT2050]
MPILPDWVHYTFPPKIHFEADCGYKVGNFVKNIGSRTVIFSTQQELENMDELSVIKTSLENISMGSSYMTTSPKNPPPKN